ncbi:MAG: ABC transporter permease subunit [Rhizobiales bacterium]|nr:ABC transporter permease subunit [Hyphomicrobiales bacterium]
MSLAAAAPRSPPMDGRALAIRLAWAAVVAGTAVLWFAGKEIAPWAVVYPRALEIPLAKWVSAAMTWLVEDATFGLFTFTQLTRAVAAVVEVPYTVALSLLATGFLRGEGSNAVQVLPPLSWVAVVAIFSLAGLHAGGRRLALLVGLCFLYLAVFGQWQSAMQTLASILVAVPVGVAGGLLLGLAGYRWPRFERAMRPFLDLMQTVPIFAYLVPILFLFGFGPVASIIATIIYAMPPMVRVTILALQGGPGEVRDLGRMIGCTRRQMTWKVMVPSARRGLMIGVNQVIMLSLNMVIIASMIGAGGLGFDVLAALRRLDITAGIQSGVAIVVLAIALDRLSQAFAESSGARARRAAALAGSPFWRRYPNLTAALVIVVTSGLLGLVYAPFQAYPDGWTVTTGGFWEGIVRWINVTFFDALDAFKNFLLLNLLIPVKRFLGALPWLGVVAGLGVAGFALGGLRLALLCVVLSLFIAVTGQWEKATVTVYLCAISVVFACLIGVPIAIWASSRDRVWRVVQGAIDTLQTLPSFVYLMPVVMLFRVGDFTAIVAVVAYAIAPVIRYTGHGLRSVNPQLIEAGVVSGCTPWQILFKIRLKLALPELLLGLNQTIMLAISMLVITALVGTRDLGQEVYIALAKADTGRGIVAGLAIAFIAIIADRLITAGAERMRARMLGPARA